MDSYGNFIDSIQPEKTNAVLAGYIRFGNISKSKMLTLVEVFIVAVAFISWSTTLIPTLFKLSGEYLFAYSSYVMNQHVVFLVGNVIVVVCYVLSGHTESPRAGNSCLNRYPIASPTETASPDISEDNDNKNDNNNNNKYRFEESCKTGSNIEPVKARVVKKEMEAETVIKQATKQLERFQRTQSVKLRREISMKPRVELRRSASERREMSTVEKLSNEEFRLAVEAFISKQQRILKQQTVRG